MDYTYIRKYYIFLYVWKYYIFSYIYNPYNLLQVWIFTESHINLDAAKKGRPLASANNQAFKSNWTIFMRIFALCMCHSFLWSSVLFPLHYTLFITSVNPHNNKATLSTVCRFTDLNSGLSHRHQEVTAVTSEKYFLLLILPSQGKRQLLPILNSLILHAGVE